jgi:hypothetical protein
VRSSCSQTRRHANPALPASGSSPQPPRASHPTAAAGGGSKAAAEARPGTAGQRQCTHQAPASPLRRLLRQQHLELGAAAVVEHRAVEVLHRQRGGRGLVELDIGDCVGMGSMFWRQQKRPPAAGWPFWLASRTDRALTAPWRLCSTPLRADRGLNPSSIPQEGREPGMTASRAVQQAGRKDPRRGGSPPLSLMTLTCCTSPYSAKAPRSVSSCEPAAGRANDRTGPTPAPPSRDPAPARLTSTARPHTIKRRESGTASGSAITTLATRVYEASRRLCISDALGRHGKARVK